MYLGKLPIPKQAMKGTLKSLVAFAGYNLLFGAVGANIDNSAHIGGLLIGLVLGAALARHLTNPPDVRRRWNWGVFVVTGVILFMFFNVLKHANSNAPPLPSISLSLKPIRVPARRALFGSLFTINGRYRLRVMSAN
ncbi:MAG: rhomboid family intramembrane serine protease [Terriglobales bacterium]